MAGVIPIVLGYTYPAFTESGDINLGLSVHLFACPWVYPFVILSVRNISLYIRERFWVSAKNFKMKHLMA